MECKNCKAQLEPGVTLCPNCGAENAERTAVAAEEVKSPELKKGITLTPGKLALVICGAVLLTALLVGVILQGAGLLDLSFLEKETEPTAPVATVPADGNPDDVTCQGSYTVTAEEAVAARDTVVATLGNAKLTNGELQIYYWMQVQQFLSQYGSYAPYFGLDYTQPLDTQLCTMTEEGLTWQQYFLRAALDNWRSYQALATEAVDAGFTLTEEYETYLQGLPASLATEGGLQGFASAEDYLAYNVGPGASMDNYVNYMRTYYQGYQYFESIYDTLAPTEEEIDAYFAEHEAEYAEGGVTRDGVYVDVRHILILPDGATLDTIYSETFPDEAWTTAESEAQSILDLFLAGEATAEAFGLLANEHSADPGSNTAGGLYESVYQGEMMEPFDAWCFDPARQSGDTGIVRTDAGYHVMYFVGSTPIWKQYAKEDLMTQRGTKMVDEAVSKYELVVNYSAIALGFVDMTA